MRRGGKGPRGVGERGRAQKRKVVGDKEVGFAVRSPPQARVGRLDTLIRDAAEVAGVTLEHSNFDVGVQGRKQLALLDRVQRQVPRRNIEAVLAEMVKFARRREWLKIAGGRKGRILEVGMLKFSQI